MDWSDRRPVVHADDAFRVVLEVERTDEEETEGRHPVDDGTILRFSEWLYAERILNFPGGMSGPGYWVRTFPISEKPAIIEWLEKERLV